MSATFGLKSFSAEKSATEIGGPENEMKDRSPKGRMKSLAFLMLRL
jgi:hypothetical protein